MGPQGPSGILTSTFVSGNGNTPTTSLQFLSPTVLLTVTTGLRLHVVASRALGSIAPGGGTALNLYICYRSTTLGAPIVTLGNGIFGLATPQNSRNIYTLSADFAPGGGTFNVGLCGLSPNATSWNSNDIGYTTVILHTD